jgi:hypothetical protein
MAALNEALDAKAATQSPIQQAYYQGRLEAFNEAAQFVFSAMSDDGSE